MPHQKMVKRSMPLCLFLWFLAVGWVCVIFFFSGQNGSESSALSMRVAGFLSRLLPGHLEASAINPFLRKLAHFGIFAVEGFLLTLALGATSLRPVLSALFSMAVCGGMAFLNELHQRYSEGRACSLRDVGIDSSGALLGVLVALLILVLVFRHCAKSRQNFIRQSQP